MRELNTGDLTAGCCGPIKLNNEYTTPGEPEPPGSYLYEGKI